MAAQSEYVTKADLDLAVSRLETLFERTAHSQTKQMFVLLTPVYGGIIISLLVFLVSKVI